MGCFCRYAIWGLHCHLHSALQCRIFLLCPVTLSWSWPSFIDHYRQDMATVIVIIVLVELYLCVHTILAGFGLAVVHLPWSGFPVVSKQNNLIAVL